MQNSNPLISCAHIAFSFGEQKVLEDVSFSVPCGKTIALVGPNGVGKSTLIRIIAGAIKPESGTVTINPKSTIAYLPQETPVEVMDRSVFAYIGDKGVEVGNLEGNLHKLSLDRGILDKKINQLSGGEKSKINLLKLINTHADIYVLDEPTNNLDARALEFLETFIAKKRDKSAFVIVSHDRQLLENCADEIVEIDPYSRKSEIYSGPFSTYMTLHQQKIANAWKEYNDYLSDKRHLRDSLQEKKLWSKEGEKGPKKTDNSKLHKGNMRDWSGRILGNLVKVAKQKIEQLESEKVEKPREPESLTYTIPVSERGGDKVFELSKVTKTLGTKTIGPIDLHIQYSDRVVISGDNGAGKTTLIKMLMSETRQDSGELLKGSKVNIGYLPQESTLSDTAIVERVRELSGEDETDFRKLLNNLGITRDEMKKSSGELSPGMRSRFELAVLILQKPNCLILDEPTNHLDIYALDFLESAIKSYTGTVILVSHDRYFLGKIGDYKTYEM